MISRSRLIKLSGVLFLTVGALMVGLAFFLPRLVDVNAYRDDIIASARSSLKRQVDFGRGEFTWHFGPRFVFDRVTVKEPDGTTDFIKAERIIVRIALLPLLEKQLALQDLSLEGAAIRLERTADGRLNISDLLEPRSDSYQVTFRTIKTRRCTLLWHDRALPTGSLTAELRNLSLDLDHLTRGKKGRVKLSGELVHGGSSSRISADGTIRLPAEGAPLATTQINADLDLKQISSASFWPYISRFVPFANPGGRIDLSSSYKGTLHDCAAKGTIRVSGASVVWPSVFHYTVAPKTLQLAYDLRLTPSLIDMPLVDLATDGFRIKGSFQMHDYRSKDPRITARASTPGTFRYEDVRSFVPYGIIEKGTSDYIENKIRSGVFKLDTGTLDGRISQITHMEIGNNNTILYIRGPVEKAVLSYGPKAPEFRNIKGHIELKDKNFNLIGMSGTFGSSPFRLNGSITEYNTDKPSQYPVRMEITPHAPEIAWLARFVGAQKLEFSGDSTLILNGSGHHTAYNLNGEWELKQAAYFFPNAIRKPFGQNNRLAFSSIIGPSETRLTSLAYSLPPLSLSASATFRYAGQPHLGFELHSNSFVFGEQLQLAPQWQHYKPRGSIQALLKGSGNPEDFSAMSYHGTITLGNFSFLPDEQLRVLSGINGTIAFKGNSLETSSISARYGGSPITAKGWIRSLKNPEAELQLTAPQLSLSDINLAPPHSDQAIRRIKASLSLSGGTMTIRSLSGLLNSSNFNISGTYRGGRNPAADLSVISTKLDIADLILLSRQPAQPVAEKKTPAPTPAPTADLKLALRLNADAGRYERLDFNRLNAVISRENGVFYLQGLETSLYGGKLKAKGRIAPGGTPENRYDLGINLERINAERLFQALDITREVTGLLSVSGDVTARGATLKDIRRTALGNIRLTLESGKLRRFNTLSKIFSILNVSQLLKGHLPDMVSGGMPYNEIKGSMAIKDGVAATSDLFISSDAINMSIIGQADLVREELDFKIGVQPLQTVDKIVNRIPVVGWILTGKDKDFVTLYFEAKGAWADPRVSAMPVSSMGTGVFNIFRRVFELPVRLFTDTGEVILGK